MPLEHQPVGHLANEPRSVPNHSSRQWNQNEIQAELFDLKHHNVVLLQALAHVTCGDESEQRQGVATMLDLIDQDIRIAGRFLRILEHNPDMLRRFPELYERAMQSFRPNRLTG